MFTRNIVSAIAISLCIMFIGGVAHADRRQYLATYGYYTPEKGEIEIEQWADSYIPKNGGTTFRTKTEIEYGITDRLMAAVYFVKKKTPGDRFHYNETKLETRYRFNEPGQNFWDTAGYLEFVRPDDSTEPYEMEMKGIFSHEYPEFNLTLNIIGEKKLRHHEKTELGYAVGIAPHMTGRTKYSLEVFGSNGKAYIMPALWITPASKQSVGIGIAKGLTGSSDNIQVRTLYAIEM